MMCIRDQHTGFLRPPDRCHPYECYPPPLSGPRPPGDWFPPYEGFPPESMDGLLSEASFPREVYRHLNH